MKILISSGRDDTNYRHALESCGVEVVGGYLPEDGDDCDGLVLCGGNDISPWVYGETVTGAVDMDESRDKRDAALVEAFRDRPILGICRGCQFLNAYFGGTLDQDISVRERHSSFGRGDLYHRVIAEEGSRMHRLFGREFHTNSSHHQSVLRLAPGFRITLRCAEDGIVEAIEHESLPIFGVQWHPERTTLNFRSENSVDGMSVFREFLRLCEEHKR